MYFSWLLFAKLYITVSQTRFQHPLLSGRSEGKKGGRNEKVEVGEDEEARKENN
jgi:hypothetical protein